MSHCKILTKFLPTDDRIEPFNPQVFEDIPSSTRKSPQSKKTTNDDDDDWLRPSPPKNDNENKVMRGIPKSQHAILLD
jgi:hypothetical protein